MADLKPNNQAHLHSEPLHTQQQNFAKTAGFLKASSSQGAAGEDPLQLAPGQAQQFAETQN